MDTPQYKQPPLDPQFAAVQARSEADRITAIQAELSHDTSSLLARYGRQQAVAGATGTAPAAMPLFGMAALGGR